MRKKSLVHILALKPVIVIYMLLASLMICVSAGVISFSTSIVVGTVLGEQELDEKKLVFLATSFGSLLILFYVFKSRFLECAAWLRCNLTKRVFNAVLSDGNIGIQKGQTINLVSDDTNAVCDFIEVDMPTAVETIVIALGMGVATCFINKVLFIVVLFLSVASSVSVIMAKRVSKLEKECYEYRDQITNGVAYIYHFVPVIGSLRNLRLVYRDINSLIVNLGEKDRKKRIIVATFSSISRFCSVLRELFVIAYGMLYAGFDIGTTVAMINVTSFFTELFSASGDLLIKLAKVHVSTERLEFAIHNPININTDKQEACYCTAKEMSLDKVHYMYDDVSGLRPISGTVKKGKINFIVGTVGTGKSTLGKIICGLNNEYGGEISVDGKKLDYLELRRLCAYVDQESIIGVGTILENITAFDDRPDNEKAQMLLEKVGLAKWINSLEKGMETLISEELGNMSGGQRQRIAIARALYKNAGVILFDEPTASLDSENASKVFDLIDSLKDEKIIIFITHDERVFDRNNPNTYCLEVKK